MARDRILKTQPLSSHHGLFCTNSPVKYSGTPCSDAGPSHGEEVAPGFIVASGDQVANDVTGVQILQEWYPTVPNMITMYVWNYPQISQAVKVGCGYARGPDDVKIVL